MSAMDRDPFPKGALIAAGALIGVSLIATAAGRIAILSAPHVAIAQAPPAQSVALRFADQADGAVIVRDGRDNAVVASLAPGTNGFVRGVMRGLVHERRSKGIGAAPPFVLSRWNDGHLALEDTATRRQIDLDAFGDGNKDAFVQLMRRPGARS
jgi:putative photosynthetic complex assembly protein